MIYCETSTYIQPIKVRFLTYIFAILLLIIWFYSFCFPQSSWIQGYPGRKSYKQLAFPNTSKRIWSLEEFLLGPSIPSSIVLSSPLKCFSVAQVWGVLCRIPFEFYFFGSPLEERHPLTHCWHPHTVSLVTVWIMTRF